MRVIRCKHSGCITLVTPEELFCSVHITERSTYLEKRKQWGQRNKQKEKRYNSTFRYSNDRSERETFYHTKEWKVLRQRALERDNHQCQYCKMQAKVSPAKIVDHIVPAQFNERKMRDLINLASACQKCHDLKTRWEQAYYGTGYYKDGKSKVLKDVKEITDLKELVFLFVPPAL
ncbi:HNH endonuclease [Lactococcus garvieae]|uniref:Putative HNH nuclease YajD n=1 Tax=Lactococcus garvieae TaxID=1363 RepID=A0A1I4I4P8_9LACT|nr:HNH endonuclease [Lactococcus garvieae]SFL49458.1 HNH endonuclease [Lactococcus garvieae]